MIKMEKHENELNLKSLIRSWQSVLGVNAKDVFINNRKRNLSEKRQLFYYLAKKLTKLSYRAIIEFIKENYGLKQHHATLLHANLIVENLLSYDKTMQKDVLEIIKNLDYLSVTTICVSDVNLLKVCIDNSKIIQNGES